MGKTTYRMEPRNIIIDIRNIPAGKLFQFRCHGGDWNPDVYLLLDANAYSRQAYNLSNCRFAQVSTPGEIWPHGYRIIEDIDIVVNSFAD
jgi:hypothetical protein